MKNTKVYLFTKKIHRMLVVAILIMSMAMATTGFLMYSGNYLSFDPLTIRLLHHQLSIFFTLLLGFMATTGLYLFIFPYLR